MLFFALLVSLPIWAAPHSRAQLLCQQNAAVAGQTLRMWVRLTPEPGWHTYWQNPGQSGLETRLEWKLPSGFRLGPMRWSLPERLEEAGIVNYAYTQASTQEVTITVPEKISTPSVSIQVKASWLVCSQEQCLPASEILQIKLPVASQSKLANWSEPLWPEVAPEGWQLTREGPCLLLQGQLAPGKLEFIPNSGLQIDESAAQLVDWQASKFSLRLVAARTPKKLERLQGLLIWGEGQAKRGFTIDLPIGGPFQ